MSNKIKNNFIEQMQSSLIVEFGTNEQLNYVCSCVYINKYKPFMAYHKKGR